MDLIIYFFYDILQGTDVYNYVRTESNVSVGTQQTLGLQHLSLCPCYRFEIYLNLTETPSLAWALGSSMIGYMIQCDVSYTWS